MSTTAASVVDVLIVEDDADTRESLRLVLELEGFVCEEAEDGRQALEAARQFRPHVILLDVMLPVLNGLKVMRKLRADERTRNILVYCLSGRADAEVQAEARLLGCEEYLVKPVEPAELIDRMRRAIKIHNDDEAFRDYWCQVMAQLN